MSTACRGVQWARHRVVTVVVVGEPQAVMVVVVLVFVLVIVECATAVHYTQDPASSAGLTACSCLRAWRGGTGSNQCRERL